MTVVSRVAGARTRTEAVVHIDYQQMVEHAVENERWRLIRQITEGIERISTHDATREARHPASVLREALAVVRSATP